MFDFSSANGLLSGSKDAENAIGHYAVSTAGHDSGKIYLVIGVVTEGKNAGELLLCDGKTKPVARPKAKKRKHVAVLRAADEGLAALLKEGGRVDDPALIHSIREFRKRLNDQEKEA